MNDQYLLAEWYIYASGPNKRVEGQKYWSGDRLPKGHDNVREAIKQATVFTRRSSLLTYLGAWTPADNTGGGLREVTNFARFFARKLRK